MSGDQSTCQVSLGRWSLPFESLDVEYVNLPIHGQSVTPTNDPKLISDQSRGMVSARADGCMRLQELPLLGLHVEPPNIVVENVAVPTSEDVDLLANQRCRVSCSALQASVPGQALPIELNHQCSTESHSCTPSLLFAHHTSVVTKISLQKINGTPKVFLNGKSLRKFR